MSDIENKNVKTIPIEASVFILIFFFKNSIKNVAVIPIIIAPINIEIVDFDFVIINEITIPGRIEWDIASLIIDIFLSTK